MTFSGDPSSHVLLIDQKVRSAYDQTSPQQLRKIQWAAGNWCHRVCRGVGMVSIPAAIIIAAAVSPSSPAVYFVLIPGMFLLAYGTVATEKRAFGQYYKAYGAQLDTCKGEPSNLRYLLFLDRLRSYDSIKSQHLQRLIPTIEARIIYRDAFFRRFPILTALSAALAMLVASGLGHPIIWSTSLGLQSLILVSMAWLVVLVFGREWRAIRPSAGAKERELLAFLHMAVIDLGQDLES